jgi:hypothetical protein
MSGFVSSPPPPSTTSDLVAHDGWFPGVRMADARSAMRFPTQVTDARLKSALRCAMLSVASELSVWKAAQIAAGADSLEAVTDEQLDGGNRLVLLYERAVFSFAAADLAETQHDISATGQGKAKLQEQVLSADEHRRHAIHAIRDITGATRTAVELI